MWCQIKSNHCQSIFMACFRLCSWLKVSRTWAKITTRQGACCNIRYPSETHSKVRVCENLFGHNVLLGCQIVQTFDTEHGCVIALICANFQNDFSTATNVLYKLYFDRCESKMSFGLISYIMKVQGSQTSGEMEVRIALLCVEPH